MGATNLTVTENRETEALSKKRAVELWESGEFGCFQAGTFATLAIIHKRLFTDVFDFAGEVRTQDISKGNFRFVPCLYLKESIASVEKLPQKTFEEIVKKYVEMNVVHPFREGNGRAMRLWLDHMLKSELGLCVDWRQVSKEDYLSAMERSPVNDLEIRTLLKDALTDKVNDREVFMKGLEQSYRYEGQEEVIMDLPQPGKSREPAQKETKRAVEKDITK